MTSFDDIERIVLAELVTREQALALANDVESLDFGHPYHRAVFNAIRDVQASASADEIGALYRECRFVLAVGDQLNDRASMQSAYSRDVADGSTLLVQLTQLVLDAPTYGDQFPTRFPRHLRELRAIARQRDLIWRAA